MVRIFPVAAAGFTDVRCSAQPFQAVNANELTFPF